MPGSYHRLRQVLQARRKRALYRVLFIDGFSPKLRKQAATTSTGRDKFGGGIGIGLTLVRKIVERHHGRI